MYNEKNLINIVVTKEIQIHDNFRRKGKIKMKARVNFYIGEKNVIFLVFCILLTGLFSSAGGRGQKVYPLENYANILNILINALGCFSWMIREGVIKKSTF